MAKDPAFLFYPGDYLRDTQCLGESAQVAYDRIMCEHMRNICISKQQLKFFTKRLSEDEIEELKMVLTEVDEGYQITWVAESIVKRKEYSESRRKNRTKNKKDINNISKTYDKHMENENENENNISNTTIKSENSKIIQKPISSVPHLVFSKADLKLELENSYETIEEIMRINKITDDKVKEYIEVFVDTLEPPELERDFWRIRKHLKNWIKLEVSKNNKENKNGKGNKYADTANEREEYLKNLGSTLKYD